MSGFSMKIDIPRWLVLGLLCLVGAGCAPSEPTLPDEIVRGRELLQRPAGGSPSGPAGASGAVLVQLRLGAVEVPAGRASGSEDIWSYLDEEAIEPVHSASLRRNGIRIGVGRAEAWPDVVRILEKMTGQPVVTRDLLAQPGATETIHLQSEPAVRTLAISHDDRTSTVNDYPPGDELLAMSYTVDAREIKNVLITGTPQIRTDKKKWQVVDNDGSLLPVVRPEVVPLGDLTFQVPVSDGEFLLIGPGAAAKSPLTVGHHFLVKQKAGIDFETVLVILPRARQVSARRIPTGQVE